MKKLLLLAALAASAHTVVANAAPLWDLKSPLTGVYVNEDDGTNVLLVQEVGPEGIFEYRFLMNGAVNGGIAAYAVGDDSGCINIRLAEGLTSVCPVQKSEFAVTRISVGKTNTLFMRE